MSTIPINPSNIAGAGVYTAPANAFPINLCKQPKEGAKALSMQFAFNVNPSWLVTFPNAPNAPMSQLCSLYVDATKSQTDVNIYFPDSGYTVRVNAQGSRLFPVITSATTNLLPTFYVLLDSSGATTSDIVNVTAINTFVPEFEANELINVLSYGYSSLFKPAPTFTQATNFNIVQECIDGLPHIFLPATQWYLTGLIIDCLITATIAAPIVNESAILQIIDGSTGVIMSFFIDIDQSSSAQHTRAYKVCSISGLNYMSIGGGGLKAQFITTIPGITSAVFALTALGGILKP